MIDNLISLMRIPSSSGTEQELARYVEQWMAPLHAHTAHQLLPDGRKNLFFQWGTPRVVFCTHMDTVPPYLPPRREGNTLFGRGACDAKGQIAVFHRVCSELLESGKSDFALLLLCGEETSSEGAQAFAAAAKPNEKYEYLIVGEPTENKLIQAAKGTQLFQFTITGKSAHSGYPQWGNDAFRKALHFLQALENKSFPEDTLLGATTWNVGRFSSPNANNIISDRVDFNLYFRTTFASHENIEPILASLSREYSDSSNPITFIAKGGDTPTLFTLVEGLPTDVVSFGSDAPRLTCFPHKLLYGPGSISHAHTPNEKITLEELQQAVNDLLHIYYQLPL